MLKNIIDKYKAKVKKIESKKSKESKLYIKNKRRENIFETLIMITALPLMIIFTISILFLNEAAYNFIFDEEKELKNYNGTIYNEIYEKKDSILTKENILESKVSKNEFANELYKNVEENYKEKIDKEYFKDEIEKNINKVKEGMYFINKNKNYSEIIATDKNGFVSFYLKNIEKSNKTENDKFNKYFEKIKEINPKLNNNNNNNNKNENYYFMEKEYKDIKVEYVQLPSGIENFSISNKLFINSYKSIKEIIDNYLHNKINSDYEYEFSLMNYSRITYKKEKEKVIEVRYLDVDIKDSYQKNNFFEIQEELIKSQNIINKQIDKGISGVFFSFLMLIFSVYGLRRAKNKTKIDLEKEKNELLNKKEVKVEDILLPKEKVIKV